MATFLDSVLPGLQGLQNTQAQSLEMQAFKQRQADDLAAQDLLADYQKTGNQDALVGAVMKSPQLANNVLSTIGLVDKQKQQAAASDIAELWQLKDNPEAFKRKIAVRANAILERGGDPQNTLQLAALYEQDPMAAIGEMKAVAAGLESKGYQTGVFAKTDQMSAYQRASTDLRKQELEFNKQQKQIELQLKTLESQLKREDNDLKRQDLQVKIDEAKADLAKKQQELEAAAKTKESGRQLVVEAYSEVNSLLKDPNLSQAIGTISTSLPTVRESTQDVVNRASRLQSLLTADSLKLMSGVLTDRDIAFLSGIASGLNVTDGGIKGSVEGVTSRLQKIQGKLEDAAKDQGIDLSASDTPKVEAPAQAVEFLRQNPQFAEQFKAKYGYLPRMQ